MITRNALCGLTLLIAAYSLLTASAHSLRQRSPEHDSNQQLSDADHDHRRLSLKSQMKTNFKVSNDPKTTQAKGYVCARGEVPWDDHDEILAEIPSYISAYHARHKFFAIELDLVKDDIVTNFGGTGLFHTFTIWVVLRKLKPKVIVESGVYRGFTSWMIARATEDYSPLIVRVDPWEVGWNGVYGNPRPDTFVDYRGDNYMDFTRIDWDELFDEHFLSPEDKASTLFILDDQADQLRRLEQLSRMGFQHVLVDENFVPAMGVAFSVKDACDKTGDLRLAFARTDKSGESSPRRCDNARKDCKYMTPTEVEKAYEEFDSLVDTYWEGPPLAPLARPYSSLMKKLEAGYIDGPSEWTLNHAKLVYQSSKPPLYNSLEEASKSTGLSEMHLSYESGRYTNMAYIKLKRQHHHHQENESRRRLNDEEDDDDPNKPKTKGYVCNKGAIAWDTKVKILSELNSFIDMHHLRQKFFKIDINNQGFNYGSFGMFHSFILWVVLRKTKPTVVIESGVAGGYTSWLISKATEEWNPLIVRIDPKLKGWDGMNLNPNASKMVNLRGDEYQDLTEVDWDALYAKHGLSRADKATTLFILDDHQDQVTRLSQIRQMGFQHVVVQSNFVPGVGDAFSLKDACDATGFVRRNFNSSTLKSVPIQPNRCTNYHKTCEKLDPFESQLVALDLDDMVKTYWEGPPLSPIVRPYQAVIPFIVDKNKFEGPKVWTENHDRLVVESTKAPFYDTLQLASTVTGFSEEYLAFESGRYVNIAYVELNPIEE